ncbi:calpain-9-like [Panulirus ornatus]|uniref:calpain-9-like n=1 Tax=Panulirus ornatus TaxID=150431 RepID=UPI003A867F92
MARVLSTRYRNKEHQRQRIVPSRGGSPTRHWANGGINYKVDDKLSTLSRYWTIDRSLARKRERSGGSYTHIKRGLRERGQLFEDSEFTITSRSLYTHKKPHLGPIVWMRPHEICARPKFIADGATKFDVEQGELGDTWLVQAVSTLTLTPKFLDRVVPPDQAFDHTYCGIFRFRFWHFGEWVEVIIDDRLPTFKGRLVYLHSTDPSEFWAALLEKAYAKLYGSYENLQQGFTTRALQDLTGGIVQSFSLTMQDKFLTYQVLNSAVPRSTLLVASINLEKDNKRNLRLRNGLVTQHAYSVTGLARVRSKLGETPLVRMAFEDFARHFTHLDLVHVGPDDWMNEPALHSKKPWRAVLARRRWRAGYNAGGGPHHTETTAMNPQFHVQIPRVGLSKCHVVVSVTQQYDTFLSAQDNKKRHHLHAIGFAVYEIPPNMTRLTTAFVSEHRPMDVTSHSMARETVTFFTLPPGDYMVVPHTAHANSDAKFLLRILTDEQSNIWEVNEDNMVFRSISLERLDDGLKIREGRTMLQKMLNKYPPELDPHIFHKFLKTHWKQFLAEKPSLELVKSLIMLRDFNISGRVALSDVPGLLIMLQFWKTAFFKFDRSHAGKTSSYHLRPALWEAGVTVSNKVLECLVLRFAKNRVLTSEAFLMALVRLHLAHERYHSIDTKMKGNPLSLEEMILMTTYS